MLALGGYFVISNKKSKVVIYFVSEVRFGDCTEVGRVFEAPSLLLGAVLMRNSQSLVIVQLLEAVDRGLPYGDDLL